MANHKITVETNLLRGNDTRPAPARHKPEHQPERMPKKAKITSNETHDTPSHDQMLKETARAAHRMNVNDWVSGRISDKQMHKSRTRLKKALGGHCS